MAFNGSKNVPDGEMIKILERLGPGLRRRHQRLHQLRPRPSTSSTCRKTDDDTVDTAADADARDGRRADHRPGAVDRERGVVLSEERARDTPGLPRRSTRTCGFYLKDQRRPDRLPIGKVQILQNTPGPARSPTSTSSLLPPRARHPGRGRGRLRRRRHGGQDQGPASPTGPTQRRPAPTPSSAASPKRGPRARLVVEPGAQPSLQIGLDRARPGPAAATPRPSAAREMVEAAGPRGAEPPPRRRIARGAEPPFLAPAPFQATSTTPPRSPPWPSPPSRATGARPCAAVEREQRRAVQYGVRQDELDREIAAMRARPRGRRRPATPPAAPRALAGEHRRHAGRPRGRHQPGPGPRASSRGREGPEGRQGHRPLLKSAFDGSGPLVFIATPTAIEGGEQAVADGLRGPRAKVAGDAPQAAPGVTDLALRELRRARARSPSTRTSPTSTPSSCASPTACA